MTELPKRLILLLILAIAVSCTDSRYTQSRDSAPQRIPIDVQAVPDAVPRFEPRTSAGNPESYRVLGQRYDVLTTSENFKQRGLASWYGSKFHGHKTANGEIYNMFAMTAAHKTLPIPSYVKVTHLDKQRSIVVRINDRGPFHDNRIIDLSYTAAAKLGLLDQGTAWVEIEALLPEPLQSDPVNVIKPAKSSVYLQVGAFSQKQNAEELVQKIKKLQLSDLRMHSTQWQGREIFRVQLGPITSLDQVEQIKAELIKMGLTQHQFISVPGNDTSGMIQ